MPPITDPDTLAKLIELNCTALSTAEAMQLATNGRDDAVRRRSVLRASLVTHVATKPGAAPSLVGELSAALAADPNAAASPEWSSRLVEGEATAAAALLTWQGQKSAFEHAIARLDAEIAEIEPKLARSVETSRLAYEEFNLAARTALCNELGVRFDDLYRDVLGPLDALNDAIHGAARGLSFDSLLAFGYSEAGSVFHTRKLYPAPDRSLARSALAAFRTKLAEVPGRTEKRLATTNAGPK